MAKKFMYVCIGMMALAVTFHVGAQYGRASYVDHSTSGIIAMFDQNVLLDNGEMWGYSSGDGWFLQTSMGEPIALPLPVSQIKFIGNYGFLVDINNNGWDRVGPAEWINVGPPGGATLTQPSTWGKIKAEWGE